MKGQKNHVVVVGGGLSGLTAANQILKKQPNTQITVLQANDYLGGRTKSISLNGCTFDLGAQFVGPSQHHTIQLAIESKNELVPVFNTGRKILELNNGISSYTSTIPTNVNIIALLQLQLTIMKFDRMAKKVNSLNPRDCELGYYWDSITLQNWLDQNIWFTKVKSMMEAAIRVILGVQLAEVSLLYFLWYVKQSGSFQQLISVQNGLQQKKTKLGTQHMSIYLGEQIVKRGGKIQLNYFVNRISQAADGCQITSEKGDLIKCDYIVIAMPPCNAQRIVFTPKLSSQRCFIQQKSFMGALTKVIILYQKQYWKEKGFSGQTLSDCLNSPVMNGFDDSRINQKGQLQPALIVFVGGGVYREWKQRSDFKDVLIKRLAQYFKVPEMLHPIDIQYYQWDNQRSINGGPVSPFAPGALSQIQDLRKAEGRIHWAGTQMATVSTGFMDGAIESGKRVSSQIIQRLNGQKQTKVKQNKEFHYTRYNVNAVRKYFEWW